MRHALAIAAVLLIAAPACAAPQAAPKYAGLYQINQMEMAGGLELRPNGRFRYALEYGAVSEEGAGKWHVDGSVIRLTSDPMPKAPVFELVKDEPAPKGELYVTLVPPGFGSWTGRPKVGLVEEKAIKLELVEAEEDGKVPLKDWWPTSLVLLVPLYEIEGTYFRLPPGTGHRLQFRFVPNDLGKARFDEDYVTIDGKNLILDRYDAKIVFKPVQPRPR
ncbi:MAG: hypothetical protein HOP96_05735 [Sphingomonas sp.]|nr:hypothetical protein [Sphingomonas sp.]